MERTRQKGPFEVFGTPLIPEDMPQQFDPDMEPEVKIPVWLRLVDLPLDLWNLSAVSKIASYLGMTLTTNLKTLRRESMDGPRIQVIMNMAQRPRVKSMFHFHRGTSSTRKSSMSSCVNIARRVMCLAIS